MTQEIETFRNIILAMWQEQRDTWQNLMGPNQPKQSHRDTYDRLAGIPQFTSKEHLEGRLPTRNERGEVHECLILPPIRKEGGCVPLLTMTWNVTGQRAQMTLHITLARAIKGDLKYFPMRFETGEGRHRFCHAQLGNRFRPTVPDWLPEKQPSFPLPAKCSVTLLLAALIALYGVDEVMRVVSAHQIHQKENYLRAIHEWIDQ